jgi:hypothetical protein
MLLNLVLAAALAVQAAPAAPLFTAQSCDDPAARKAMLAAGVDGFSVFANFKRHGAANEARTDAMLDRLVERGKLSPKQRAGVALKMIADPTYKSAHKDGGVLLEAMMADLGRMTEGDTASNCRIIIGLADTIPAIQAATDRQWDALRAVIGTEAKGLGISLAD